MMAGAVSREAKIIAAYMIAYGLLFANILVFSNHYIQYGSIMKGIARGPFRIEAVLNLRIWLFSVLIILNAFSAFLEELKQ